MVAVISPPPALAGGGPQNVAVIVNPKDPDSLAVGNAYITLRGMPGQNVIYIPWAPDVRSAPGAQFREKLLKPLFAELDRRKLKPQIDVVAFSCGYPYMVDFNAEFGGGQTGHRANAPVASLNGAAYLYQQVLARDAEAFALNSNSYFFPPQAGPTRALAFSSQTDWLAGMPAAARGRRYLLATVLGATYGRGNKVPEIIDYLRRAKAADGTRPKGTIYYMHNANIRSQVRHSTFPAAVAELKSLGANAQLLQGVAPNGKTDVAGLTTGTSHLQLAPARCKFAPGALVDNLTSAAGQLLVARMVANPQTPVSEFLRAGATGASGTVVEPLAIPAKFPSAALHVHYVRGLSLAEAFYRSIEGPYQLLIIGDPLCQPWAMFPQITVEGLSDGSPLSGAVELKPTAAYADSRSVRQFELYVDGLRVQSINRDGTFQLDTTQLADGWHELRIVAIDATDAATQGTKIAEVQVKNGADTLELNVDSSRISVDGATSVRVTSTVDYDATVMHNGRALGRLPKGRGRLQISGAGLGRGKSRLYAIQESEGKEALRSRPVTVDVY